jgi:hypothetical protein
MLISKLCFLRQYYKNSVKKYIFFSDSSQINRRSDLRFAREQRPRQRTAGCCAGKIYSKHNLSSSASSSAFYLKILNKRWMFYKTSSAITKRFMGIVELKLRQDRYVESMIFHLNFVRSKINTCIFVVT